MAIFSIFMKTSDYLQTTVFSLLYRMFLSNQFVCLVAFGDMTWK